MAYNISKLHKELVDAGIPITGVYLRLNESGEQETVGIHYVSETDKDLYAVQSAQIIENHVPYDYGTFRRKHYPPVGDQLDCLYKGGDDETAWKAQITAVKNRWTKSYSDLTAEDKVIVDSYYFNGGA